MQSSFDTTFAYNFFTQATKKEKKSINDGQNGAGTGI